MVMFWLLLVLAWKFVSLPYTAVIVWMPGARALVVNVAWCEVGSSVPVLPSVVPPSIKLTVPSETPPGQDQAWPKGCPWRRTSEEGAKPATPAGGRQVAGFEALGDILRRNMRF